MKKVLITGAGSGLGLGSALGLAKAGHNVFATVQARSCRSETDPRPLWSRTSSHLRGQAKWGNAEEI